MARYAFKFISGKYQGGEFPIPENGEILIGRASDLDLVLVEDMVSRKHAKLVVDEGRMNLTDLGSTNGTFVNGEKIKRHDIGENDRVLIGTSILKVIPQSAMAMDEEARRDRAVVKEMMEELGNRAAPTSTMSGDLQEVPLPDLLQLFGTNRKSGILRIRGVNSGDIYIKQGQLMSAKVRGHEFSPRKALGRMLTWEAGSFQLDNYDEDAQFDETFTGSTESILIDELRSIDEVRRLSKDLPPADSKLVLCEPLVPKLSALSSAELDFLQMAINFGELQTTIDKSDEQDYVVIRGLHGLLTKGYIDVD